MNEDALIGRLAGNATNIEMAADRLTALELAVCWLLFNQPNDDGGRFLSRQANELEESGKAPGVVAELDLLRAAVSDFREMRKSSQDVRRIKPGS
jgi:hypothetical protein